MHGILFVQEYLQSLFFLSYARWYEMYVCTSAPSTSNSTKEKLITALQAFFYTSVRRSTDRDNPFAATAKLETGRM